MTSKVTGALSPLNAVRAAKRNAANREGGGLKVCITRAKRKESREFRRMTREAMEDALCTISARHLCCYKSWLKQLAAHRWRLTVKRY